MRSQNTHRFVIFTPLLPGHFGMFLVAAKLQNPCNLLQYENLTLMAPKRRKQTIEEQNEYERQSKR